MRIAVNGCSHAHIDQIYHDILEREKRDGVKVDLVLLCGDFQAIRNTYDLHTLACPIKYRRMGDFHDYYSGRKRAPILTLFIGGNHEATRYLRELYYGGWVCENIYYLGHSGVVNVNGLRIAGVSGIYKEHDYRTGYFERHFTVENELRSAYHVREYEIVKLSQITEPLDIMISHDWPRNIHQFGNERELFRRKPFLRDDYENNRGGNPETMNLLKKLKPKFWFAGHMHCHFEARVMHSESESTQFIALSKPLKGHFYLDFIDIEPSVLLNSEKKGKLFYDAEWVQILQKMCSLMPLTKRYPANAFSTKVEGEIMLDDEEDEQLVKKTKTEEHEKIIYPNYDDHLQVPLNFKRTVPIFDENDRQYDHWRPDREVDIFPFHPQTNEFCQLAGIKYPGENK